MSSEQYINAFYQFSQQPYYEVLKDKFDHVEEFNIGVYAVQDGHSAGGTKGEFSISWKYIGQDIVAAIRIYTDAWHLLGQPEYQNLFAALSVLGEHVTPTQVQEVLIANGFVNLAKK